MQNAWNVSFYALLAVRHAHPVVVKKCCLSKLERVINRSWPVAQHTQTKSNLKTLTIHYIIQYSHEHSFNVDKHIFVYGAVLIIKNGLYHWN